MKRSEIYRKAARMIDSGDNGCYVPGCGASCCALSAITSRDDGDSEYRSVQQPYRNLYANAEWWNERKTPDYQSQRVLALLFMAAIAESEE